MPMADRANTPEVRNLEAGMLLIGLGAILLFISLWLTWYQPEIDAWEIFEVWDLVLAVLAIVALVAVASRLGFGPPRPSSWLIGPAVAALVIVLYCIVNPPPLTRGVDGDPDTGLWLALAASILMTAGAVLSVARISVAFAPSGPGGPGPGSGGPGGGVRPGRRFGARGPGHDAGEPDGLAGPGHGVAEPGPGGLGGHGVGDPRPGGGAPPAADPTERTRRL